MNCPDQTCQEGNGTDVTINTGDIDIGDVGVDPLGDIGLGDVDLVNVDAVDGRLSDIAAPIGCIAPTFSNLLNVDKIAATASDLLAADASSDLLGDVSATVSDLLGADASGCLLGDITAAVDAGIGSGLVEALTSLDANGVSGLDLAGICVGADLAATVSDLLGTATDADVSGLLSNLCQEDGLLGVDLGDVGALLGAEGAGDIVPALDLQGLLS